MANSSFLESLVARELRRAIAVDGRSMNAVGQAAGFSRSYLSQLLRGRQDLKLQHVERVLEVLGVDLEPFLRQVADAFREGRAAPSASSERSRASLSQGRDEGLGSAGCEVGAGAGAGEGSPESPLAPGQLALREAVREVLRRELPRDWIARLVREEVAAVRFDEPPSGALPIASGGGAAELAEGPLEPLRGRVERGLEGGEHDPRRLPGAPGDRHRAAALCAHLRDPERLARVLIEPAFDPASGVSSGRTTKTLEPDRRRDLLRQRLTSELNPELADDLHRHVERGCGACLVTLRELLAEAEDLGPQALDSSGPRLTSEEREGRDIPVARQTLFGILVLENERRLAPALLEGLDALPAARRGDVVRADPRYQLFGFAEYLSEESRRAGFRDVARAQELAELAVEVADALDPKIYLPSVILDCQALCRAFLGNARRVASDLFGAERAFQDALFHLERGADSEVVRAEVLSLLGSLRTDQGRYLEARRALEESLDFFRRFGQPEDAGKVLFKLAKTHAKSGEPAKAVEMLERALPVIDEAGDQWLAAVARHTLVGWLVDAGDPLEALARFEKAQEHYERFRDDPWFQLRRTWQEAYVHAALGDAAHAEPLYEEVRQAATERELPYELAMINLELAILHLDQGHPDKVRQLAEEMVPIFRSRELHAHAMAAVYLFQHAARTQTATAELAKEVLHYLQRAQNNPYLPFR